MPRRRNKAVNDPYDQSVAVLNAHDVAVQPAKPYRPDPDVPMDEAAGVLDDLLRTMSQLGSLEGAKVTITVTSAATQRTLQAFPNENLALGYIERRAAQKARLDFRLVACRTRR